MEDFLFGSRANASKIFIYSQISVPFLKNGKTTKRGFKGKRLKAGWDKSYLEKVLKIRMRMP